jgi:molybdopterin/thiamine biosynthesis adenylyltransferase
VLVGRTLLHGGARYHVVRAASGPGPRAVLAATRFVPDVEHYKHYLRAMLVRYGFELLGEWHKHPDDFHAPSGTDSACVADILRREGRPSYLCVIANELPFSVGRPVDLHAYQLDDAGRGFDDVPIRVAEFPAVPDSPPEARFVSLGRGLLEDFLTGPADRTAVPCVRYGEGCYRAPPLPGEGPNSQALLLRAGGQGPEECDLPTESADLFVTVRGAAGGARGQAHSLDAVGELTACDTLVLDPGSDCFARNAGVVETHRLAGRHAVLVGVGSVGSTAAAELTKAGVGRFTLIDPDRLQPVNVSRHLCDLRDLGRLKALAVADKLRCINPAVRVDVWPGDITQDAGRFHRVAGEADVVVVSTDTAGSRALANEVCAAGSRPCVFISLTERARNGDVQVVWPGRTGCRACLGRATEDLPRGPVPYSQAHTERDANVQPGLSADIGVVTLLGVREVLRVLQPERGEDVAFLRWQPPALYRVPAGDFPGLPGIDAN